MIVISFIALAAISSLKAEEEGEFKFLTGDTGLACEAILCLSSPIRPSECMRSLTRYFSIHFRKPWKTVNARKAFLNLCPAGSMTPQMKDQVDKLSQITGYCTIQELNANLEKKKLFEVEEEYCDTIDGCTKINVPVYGYRTSPTMTKNCQILKSMSYNDYNFKYTCNKEFYKAFEWDSGKQALHEISEEEYENLDENSRLKWIEIKKKYSRNNDGTYDLIKIKVPHFYTAKPIKKDCWIDNR